MKNQESDFSKIVDAGVSRRRFLQGGATAMGMFLAANPVAQAVAASTQPESKLLGFTKVATSTADTFVVPEGYVARPLISWGDPILKGAPAFNENGQQPASAQAGQFGDNTDGMSFFPLTEDRALLAVNNEYTNYKLLFDHKGQAMTADDVKKPRLHTVCLYLKSNAPLMAGTMCLIRTTTAGLPPIPKCS